jgi:ATP-dependent DNA helicase RecG
MRGDGKINPMKPSLLKLQKFFKLEAERGYDNRAVVGGLDRILSSWEAEARVENLPEDLIQAVSSRLRDYPTLSESSRAESLEGLWRRIQRETEESLEPLIPLHESSQPESSSREESSSTQNTHQPASERSSARSERRSSPSPAQRSHRKERARTLEAGERTAALNAPVTVLSGVGPRHGQTLARLGIQTLGDMLYFFPRRYDDYSQLKPINRLFYGEEVTIIGTIESVNLRPTRSGKVQLLEAIISDGSGALRLNWFNQPWLAKRLRSGVQVVISGKVDQYLGRLVMNNPEMEQLEQQNLHTNRIVPVYPLTANITQRWLRSLLHQVISYWSPRVEDPLPETILDSADLIDLSMALLQVHFPDSWEDLYAAQHRLAFDEIFMLQLGVLRQKHQWQDRTARAYPTDQAWLENILSLIPFELTAAQQRAWQDLQTDFVSGHPMNRLLQGDVGSGKTIVAATGVALMASHNVQSAIMAPTSILAEQHYKNIRRILCAPPEPGDELEGTSPAAYPLAQDEIRLIIGATPEAEKQEIREGLASGKIKVVIGTHALIEDPVVFSDLQFIVVDEQHRFGVEQRARLRAKGENPHLLVMTATPIPRSLALTVYGDLDLSIIDEMPPGRQDVETQVFYPRERERAYSVIRSQIEAGHQAFIIYPLVEESESIEAKAAVKEYEILEKEVFSHARVGLLHGRMKAEEKEQVMTEFRDGVIDILVSTAVVEVGVDVPNATTMLIEGANRFGLAQLHQFRGRVGRGAAESYCILIPENSDSAENERLMAMVETNNGFILAERDLEQRGPGEFLGFRQSGYQTELRQAKLTDVALIEKSRKQATALFEIDPDLSMPEHQKLGLAMERFWGIGKGDIS